MSCCTEKIAVPELPTLAMKDVRFASVWTWVSLNFLKVPSPFEKAVVGAFGHAADDISAGVETNQALRDVLQKDRVRFVQGTLAGVAQLRFAADHDDVDRALGPRTARARSKRERGDQQQGQQAPHDGRLAAMTYSASIWIYLSNCFT